jgi:outer membrane protein
MAYTTPPALSRHTRTLPSRLAIATLLAALAGELQAFELGDPFATRASPLPPGPDHRWRRPALPGPPGRRPVYGVLEVVDLALCRNPTTREVWSASARAGGGRSVSRSRLPADARRPPRASRVRIDSRSANQRNAALTLSWLLFDFGARSANLEVGAAVDERRHVDARRDRPERLPRRAAGLLQCPGGARGGHRRPRIGKASRESLTAAEVRYRSAPAPRPTGCRRRPPGRRRRSPASAPRACNATPSAAWPTSWDSTPTSRCNSTPRGQPGAELRRRRRGADRRSTRAPPRTQGRRSRTQGRRSPDIDYARAAGLPTLSLNAGPQVGDLGGVSANSSSIGLTLNLPLFSGFNTTYNVRAAASPQRRPGGAPRQRPPAGRARRLGGLPEPEHRHPDVRTSADLLASAEHSERVALGRYKAGVGNILDVLNAQSALANARLQRIQACSTGTSRAPRWPAPSAPSTAACCCRSAGRKPQNHEDHSPEIRSRCSSSSPWLPAVLLVPPEHAQSLEQRYKLQTIERGEVTQTGLGQRHAQPGGAGQCRHAGFRHRHPALRRLQRQGREGPGAARTRRPAARRAGPAVGGQRGQRRRRARSGARQRSAHESPLQQEYVSRQELEQAIQARRSSEAQLAQAQGPPPTRIRSTCATRRSVRRFRASSSTASSTSGRPSPPACRRRR